VVVGRSGLHEGAGGEGGTPLLPAEVNPLSEGDTQIEASKSSAIGQSAPAAAFAAVDHRLGIVMVAVPGTVTRVVQITVSPLRTSIVYRPGGRKYVSCS
jgi:hypothetical protein